MKLTLPTDSDERKNVPLLSGCMNYFPAALAWIARISLKGDKKHNPENKGPPHHSRGKSADHGDCIIRHTMDIEDLKAYIARSPVVEHPVVSVLLVEAAYRAWRACADLQELCEKYDDAPLAPAAIAEPLPFGKLVEQAFKDIGRRAELNKAAGEATAAKDRINAKVERGFDPLCRWGHRLPKSHIEGEECPECEE